MGDYIVRATAADNQIRAFAATTRELVEKARLAHNTSPVATAALGRLLTGGAMMGVMMKGEKDVLTIQVKGDGPIGGLTVTADSQGHVKGYVDNPCLLYTSRKQLRLVDVLISSIRNTVLVKTNNSIPMGWGLKKSQPFLLLKKNKKEGEG